MSFFSIEETFQFFNTILANCNEFENTCLSSECIQAASIILSHLDTKTNPCKDFFQFTCGKFADPTTIPENKNYVSTSSNTFIELQRQLRELLDEPLNKEDKKHTIIAKNYYKACNNIGEYLLTINN